MVHLKIHFQPNGNNVAVAETLEVKVVGPAELVLEFSMHYEVPFGLPSLVKSDCTSVFYCCLRTHCRSDPPRQDIDTTGLGLPYHGPYLLPFQSSLNATVYRERKKVGKQEKVPLGW